MDESRLADEGTFKNVVNVHIISSDVNYTTVTTSLTHRASPDQRATGGCQQGTGGRQPVAGRN